MRKLVIALSTVALGVGTLVAPITADAAVVPAATATAYIIDTTPYNNSVTRWVGAVNLHGQPEVNGFSLRGQDSTATESYTKLTHAEGHPFTAGTIALAATPDETHAGYEALLPTTLGCSNVQGELTVHAVTYDEAGLVTSFAGSSEVTCDGGQTYVGQEYRWDSTVPIVRKIVTAGTWSPVEKVTITAPQTATYGPAALDGEGKGLIKISADTCSGTHVAAGSICSFDVSLYAGRVGPAQGVISLYDTNGVAATLPVPVTVVGNETKEGGYVGVAPARLLDTRKKIGVGTTTPLSAGKTLALQVTGRGGVPSTGVRAVVLNLTAVSPTSRGYLTAYPTGQNLPTASSINFDKGWTGANLVTVGVGAGGKVTIRNQAGNTHVAADVMGFYTTNAFAPTTYSSYYDDEPFRAVDTRTDDWDRTPLDRDEYLWQGLNYGPEWNSRITALAANVTVVKPTGTGYLSAWDGQESNIPSTSSLNFTKGRTVPNMQIVPVSQVYIPSLGYTLPRFGVVNRSNGSAHVIVDVVGVYADNTRTGGLRYKGLPTPTRIVDTRKAQGTSPLGPNQTKTVIAPAPVAGYNTAVLVTNTTAVAPTVASVLTLWRTGLARPSVSNLNPYAGQVVSNMTMTSVGAKNDYSIHNVAGTTNLVMDIAGTLEFYPARLEPVGRKEAKSALAPSATQLATSPLLAGQPAGGVHRGALG